MASMQRKEEENGWSVSLCRIQGFHGSEGACLAGEGQEGGHRGTEGLRVNGVV